MKTHTQRKTPLIFCAAIGALGLSLSAMAKDRTPKIVTFDPPGAAYTYPQAISPTGAITGYYQDANNIFHGFVRARDGDFATFDAPAAGTGQFQGTFPASINPAGAITGYYYDANFAVYSFLRAPDGGITTFQVPNLATWAYNINPRGEIAGDYFDFNLAYHGFVRAPDGTVTTFDAPGAGTGFLQGTVTASVDGLNPEGWVTGSFTDAQGINHGYVRAPDGAISTFDAPGASQSTIPVGINPEGTVSGFYYGNVIRSFVRTPDGAITTFNVEGQGNTVAQGINPAGQVPGWYVDANGLYSHGFVRAPNGTITTFDPPGAGTGPNQGTVAFINNPAGAITGYYIDQNYLAHGFLLTSPDDN